MANEEWQECFMVYDPESEGTISSKDAAEAARALGCNPSEWELQDIMSTMTEPGRVTYNEFCTVMGQLDSGGSTEANVKEAFQQFDRDNKGNLLGGELRYILKTMGEVLNDAELDDLFKQAGFKDDSVINYNDFVSKILSGVKVPGASTGKKGISKGRERRSMRFHK